MTYEASFELEEALGRLPAAPAAIALVRSGKLPRWSAGAAHALASEVSGTDRRVLLLNLEPPPSLLDRLVGGMASRGLAEVLLGEARPAEAAVTGAEGGAIYLPAGSGPRPTSSLLTLPALDRLIRSALRRGSTAFLYLTEEQAGAEGGRALERLVDAAILLGPSTLHGATDLPVLARIAAPPTDLQDEAAPRPSPQGKKRVRGRVAAARPAYARRLPSRAYRRRSDPLAVLLFIYLAAAGFAVALWALGRGGGEAEAVEGQRPSNALAPWPEPGSVTLQPPDTVVAGPDDSYSSLTGVRAPWSVLEENLLTLDSLLADSTRPP